MQSKRSFECSKIFVTLGCLLFFSLTLPVQAADYVWLDSGVHDISEPIGGYLIVSYATANLLPGSHIVSLYGDGDIYALEGSTINLVGCIVDGFLYISTPPTNEPNVTIFGSELVLDGNSLDPSVAEINNPDPVNYVFHELSGLYEDGTPFTINVSLDPLAKISLRWPEIAVSPLSWDYGNVAIGEPNICLVTIMNEGSVGLEVSSVTLDPAGSADFAITSAPAAPFVIPPSEARDIEITFTPSAEGYVSTTMSIMSSDANESTIEVQLSGSGEVTNIPPAQQIEAIMEFFNLSIEGGTLLGYGPGNSPEKRVQALRNMMEAVSDLISLEYYALAAEQLESIAKKTDGETRPPDFVVGEAVAPLNAMIQALIEDLSS